MEGAVPVGPANVVIFYLFGAFSLIGAKSKPRNVACEVLRRHRRVTIPSRNAGGGAGV
jgi:hypothetical protein